MTSAEGHELNLEFLRYMQDSERSFSIFNHENADLSLGFSATTLQCQLELWDGK